MRRILKGQNVKNTQQINISLELPKKYKDFSENYFYQYINPFPSVLDVEMSCLVSMARETSLGKPLCCSHDFPSFF